MAIQMAVTRQLSTRIVHPDTPAEECKKRGARKDLYGVGDAIDTFAVCSNLKGRARDVIHRNEKIWGESGADRDLDKYRADPIHAQRLQAVIAGSLRAYDRLHRAGLLDSEACKWCQCMRGTLQHLVWECPRWAEQRDPFLKLLALYRQQLVEKGVDASRIQAYDELLTLQCIRNCGVAPESDYFCRGGAPIPARPMAFGARNSGEDALNPRQREELQRDNFGRVIAYTDGSAINPNDPRRRRATWAVRFAFEHPWNASGTVDTPLQTAHRGELMAILHAFKSAAVPTRVVADCKAAVDLVRAELEGSEVKITGDHADLWADIRDVVKDRGEDFFAIEWVNSHIPLEIAAEVEEAGGFEKRHIEGNHGADKDAASAFRDHPIDWGEYAKADDREFVSVVVQALIESVWAQVFAEDQLVRDADERDDDDARQRECHEGDFDEHDDHHGFDMDPLDLTNQQLAQHVKRCTPDFGWTCSPEGGAINFCFNDVDGPVQVKRRGTEYIRGRGTVSVAYAYPPTIWSRLSGGGNNCSGYRRRRAPSPTTLSGPRRTSSVS